MRNTVSYSDRNFKYWGVNEAVPGAALYKPRTVERVLRPPLRAAAALRTHSHHHAFRYRH